MGETRAGGGERRVEGGVLWVAISLAIVRGAVWGVP